MAREDFRRARRNKQRTEGDPVEVESYNFGGDKNAINRHSVRVYQYQGQRFMLDRCTDAFPPYFTLYEVSLPQPIAMKVGGVEEWEAPTWAKAEPTAFAAIRDVA